MNTLEAVLLLTFAGWLFLTRTWIGRSIIMIIRSFIMLCKNLYWFTKWIYKNMSKLNKKMKYKVNGKPNTSHGKVVYLNAQRKAK